MSAKVERVTRKIRNTGGIVEYTRDMDVKSSTMVGGEMYMELADGRVAHVPAPRGLVWDGKKFVEKTFNW